MVIRPKNGMSLSILCTRRSLPEIALTKTGIGKDGLFEKCFKMGIFEKERIQQKKIFLKNQAKIRTNGF